MRKIDINWSKEKLIEFLENNVLIKEKKEKKTTILDNFEKEDIDGEAVSLLSQEDFKNLGIQSQNQINKMIIPSVEKNILKIKNNIQSDRIYINVHKEDLNDLWNSLNEKISELKLGEKFKFLKYLLIRDPPPDKEPKEKFIKYLEKVFKNEEDLNTIKDYYDDLFTDNISLSDNYETFKLKIILELIKQKEENKNKKGFNLDEKKEKKTIELLTPVKDEEKSFDNVFLNMKNNYTLYSLIQRYEYKTSQNEKDIGVCNPKEEYQKIIGDFSIKKESDYYEVNYDEAFKIKLTSFMLWGSKEGLNIFWKNHNINNAIDYFKDEKKEGIYLCIEKDEKIAYLIIWPGEDTYNYSNLEEPNKNLLLTLLRYGFSFSKNSILCLTEDEVNNDNFKSDQSSIFKKDKGLYSITIGVQEDGNNEKIFKINDNCNIIKKRINEGFNNKNLIYVKLRNNYILFYEDKSEISNISYLKNIYDFIKSYSEYDYYFEKDFDCSSDMLYHLIRKKINDQTILDDYIKIKIRQLLRPLYDELLDEEKIMNIFLCKYCHDKNKIEPDKIYFKQLNNDIEYFHKECYLNNTKKQSKNSDLKSIKEGDIINIIKINKYDKCKEKILNSNNYFKNDLNKFFQNCEIQFKKKEKGNYYLNKVKSLFNKNPENKDYIIDEKIINQEIELLEIILQDKINLIDNIKESELNKNNEAYFDKNETSIETEWKNKIITIINDNIKKNRHNLKKYIILKSVKNFNIKFDLCEKKNDKTIPYLYEVIQISNTIQLSLEDTSKSIRILDRYDKYEIFDYFPKDEKTNVRNIEIYTNIETNQIMINFHNIPNEFNGLYDYDPMSDTLILCKIENKENKIGIYLGKKDRKSINPYFIGNNVIKKILLIPCLKNYENQSALLFLEMKNEKEDRIYLFNFKKNNLDVNFLVLSKEFKYKNFHELQFIIYIDFLLILKYEGENKWKGKVYSLNLVDNSLFKNITDDKEININDTEKSLFSFYEINNNKYLISININQNELIIKYWTITSKLSSFTSLSKGNNNESNNDDLPKGNCIINYFYHCFYKYHLISSIEYNRGINNKLKFSVYLENTNNIEFIKEYILKLKNICQDNKKINFEDINFEFVDDYKAMYIGKDSSIGEIIIKALEATPLQIAKIMNNEFQIMSDIENDKKASNKSDSRNNRKETNFNEFIDRIRFGIKDHFFNYFELPVVVICCFGIQSIGKSTLLNELTGSIFNVSGMRCTEGIWMSVKIFSNYNKEEKKEKDNCRQNCSLCNKNNCCYYLRHKKECLCENCICGKKCELYGNSNCKEKCYLQKDHEELIKCSSPNCICKCKCNCKCGIITKDYEKHSHICKNCFNKKLKKCQCECNCRHLCKIPIINHDFICVSLDFEGLGTFERRSEHDVQMALVGASIGNNIIFRMGPSFDQFTEEFLEKLSSASRRVKGYNNNQFLGGALCFSPKDIKDKNHSKELFQEFQIDLEKSVNNWRRENNENNTMINEDNNHYIFGLFKNVVWAPTPVITERDFYHTLREQLNKEIVQNSQTFHRRPIYGTWNEFYKNLKFFLSAVYFKRYDLLDTFPQKEVEMYIEKNKNQAYSICGILNKNNELEEKLVHQQNDFKLYINRNFLKSLEKELINNTKYEVENQLILDNIKSSGNINKGIYKIPIFDECIIDLEIITNENEKESFSLEIKNLNDFGLILNIPNEIINEVTIHDICDNLYKIWDNIGKVINLNEKDRSLNYQIFINHLIKRRNNNVYHWLEQITKDLLDLKKNIFNEVFNINNSASILNQIWEICQDKCKHCYNRCYLLKNHVNKMEHKCFYDHKCKGKCQFCPLSKCEEKGCGNNCTLEMSHPDPHSCLHFHPCNDKCILNENSNNCEINCILEYGHKEPHTCGKKIHYCKGTCSLNDKARNCNIKCCLEYPHEGKEHICNSEKHLCKLDCELKEETTGCNEKCALEYNHKENNHLCDAKHYCKHDCFYKDKAEACGETCNLEYPHKGKEHNCEKLHKCKENCFYKDISKNCEIKCILNYHEEGQHTCGVIHDCNKQCYLFNEAKKCGGECKLKLPHKEGEKHICDKIHYCNKKCSLLGMSRNCKEDCVLKYGHKEACLCSLEKDKHICNKTCIIKKGCERGCILPVNHTIECLCGNCGCPKPCKYSKSKRSCHQICKLKAGHDEKEHICDSLIHYCEELCQYKALSRNCEGFCKLEPGHDEKTHICSKSKIEHECNGICIYKGKARNCNKKCKLEVGHSGDHECSSEHLCDKLCCLNDFSQNCKKFCNSIYGHSAPHICDLDFNFHICNKTCSLNNFSKSGCEGKCHLPVGHEEECMCKKKKDEHICNKKCYLENCKNPCSLPAKHEGPHICYKKEEEHDCNGKCFLNGKNRTIKGEKCRERCCYKYKHEGDCRCSNYIHLCEQICDLKNDSRGCQEKCSHFYGHEKIEENNKISHKCNAIHFCNQPCFYEKENKNNSDKIKCNKICCLEYDHEGKHICKEPHFHPCNKEKNCYLYNDLCDCNKNCCKEIGHEGKCICDKPPEEHGCKHKCELCEQNIECGHVFNHENCDNLKCHKCNDKICKLSKKGHLCGSNLHKCRKLCEEKCCKIESLERNEERIYTTKEGKEVHYRKVLFQQILRNQCNENLPPNEFEHEGKHICNASTHQCGYQCRQCEYYCTKNKGHDNRHSCEHGNIKNSSIYVRNTEMNESDTSAIVKKENQNIELKEGESAEIFVCDEYCKEQGQGHTHYFESEYEIINENVIKIANKNNLYECKCSYFWENILNFDSKIITSTEKKIFSLCNWKCQYQSHQTPEYCQLKLWHAPTKIIPQDV